MLNDRANMNCVTSSPSTTGLRTIHLLLRTIHLLRSILFRALPSHAIPTDFTLCLHLCFIIKISPEARFRSRNNIAVTPSQHVPPSQRKLPLDCMCRSLSLTQLNLPVVMSMMNTLLIKKSIIRLFHKQLPASCFPANT